MPIEDPFDGPLAYITGRLQKLVENNQGLQSPEAGLQDKIDGLLFEAGMLSELMLKLANEVALLLPLDHDCARHNY
jgi:hypothetical protein